MTNISDIKNEIFSIFKNYSISDHFEIELIGNPGTVTPFPWIYQFNKVQMSKEEIIYKITFKPISENYKYVRNHTFVIYLTLDKEHMKIINSKTYFKSPFSSINFNRYQKLSENIIKALDKYNNDKITIDIIKFKTEFDLIIEW